MTKTRVSRVPPRFLGMSRWTGRGKVRVNRGDRETGRSLRKGWGRRTPEVT